MNKKVLPVLVVALSVAIYAVGGVAAGGTTTATAFVLQNLGSSTANASVEFRDTAGTLQTGATKNVTIPVGAAVNFDQRYDTTLASGFRGAVVASSDQQLGSVVNLMRSATVGTSAAPGYESYNGFDAATLGTSVKLPQILKAVSSGGLFYNTEIAVQNTDTTNAATVSLTFTPDPTLNPVICTAPSTCISAPVTKSGISIPAGGTYVLNQKGQTDPVIGDKFFGSVAVTSDRNVAVQVLSTGENASGNDQVLLAYPSYAAGTTGPIALSSVYKNLVSLGDSYSTAFLIVNFSSVAATVKITYTAGAVGTAAATPDTISVAANSVKNVDQRYADAPAITSASFLGSAVASADQQIAIMVNLRGGSRYAFTYDGITGGSTKVFLPVGYKNIASAGYSWSSTAIVRNFGAAPANIRFDYIDNRSGHAAVLNQGPYVVDGTVQFDLRYHPSTTSMTDFFGAMVINSDQPVGAMVQTRGAGGSGDALLAYKGLGQ